MDYNKIYSRFASAESKREIDFSSMNMDEKIAYLRENSTVTIVPDQKYTVLRTVRFSDYETPEKYAIAALAIGANFADVASKRDVTAEVKIAGKDLSKRDQIAVLSKGADISAGKITVDRFGGDNFVNFCKWIREMSAEEFEALTNTK